jgi:hypothetical protein
MRCRVDTKVEAVENSEYPGGGFERCLHPNDLILDASGIGSDESSIANGEERLLSPDLVGGGVGCKLGCGIRVANARTSVESSL